MNEDQTHRVGLRGIKAFQVESVRITTNLKRPFPTDALRTLIEMRLRTASIPVVDTTESAHLTNAAIIQPIFTINTIHVETVQGPMTICGMNFFFGVFDRVTIERSGWTGWKPTYTVSFMRCCAITQLEENMRNILTTTMDNVVNDYLAAQCDSALDENEEEDDPPFNRP